MNSNYIKKRQMYFDFIENMGIKITSKSEFQFESLYCYDICTQLLILKLGIQT